MCKAALLLFAAVAMTACGDEDDLCLARLSLHLVECRMLLQHIQPLSLDDKPSTSIEDAENKLVVKECSR